MFLFFLEHPTKQFFKSTLIINIRLIVKSSSMISLLQPLMILFFILHKWGCMKYYIAIFYLQIFNTNHQYHIFLDSRPSISIILCIEDQRISEIKSLILWIWVTLRGIQFRKWLLSIRVCFMFRNCISKKLMSIRIIKMKSDKTKVPSLLLNLWRFLNVLILKRDWVTLEI